MHRRIGLLIPILLSASCGQVVRPDAGLGQDGAAPDAGPMDSATDDATIADAAPEDAQALDAAGPDAANSDAASPTVVSVRLRIVGQGTVTGPGMTCNGDCTFSVDSGSRVSLQATPNQHWSFAQWSQAGCADPQCVVTPEADLDLTVTFERRTYPLQVTLSGLGAGTVTATAVGLSCTAGTCSADVQSERLLTLQAAPDAMASFGGWGGDCVGLSEQCTVRMDRARSVIAAFDDQPVFAALQIVREGDGAADGVIQGAAGAIVCPSQCAASLQVGTSVTLDASTSINTTVFSQWTSGPCVGQGARCTFTMAQGHGPIGAEFLVNRLSVSAAGAPGSITSDVGGINCGTACQSDLPQGTQITLSAVPGGPDQRFERWSGACAGTVPTCVLTLDGPASAQAHFIVRPPPITNHQAADLVLGQPSFTTDLPNNGGESISTLNQPRYCHTDGTRLWVGDGANARVLQWNSMPVQPFMQPANVVIGQASPTQHNYGTTQSTFNERPGNLGIVNGRLYVADFMNSRILMWNTIPTSHGVAADAVLGQTNSTNGFGGLSASRYDRPYTLSISGSRLFVVDTFNHRVLGYTNAPSQTGYANADLVLGQFDGSGAPSFLQEDNPSPPTAGSMHYPFDTAHDPITDRFFVVDTHNNRVLGWNSLPSPPRPADFVLGQVAANLNAANAGQAGPNAIGFDGPRTAFVHSGSLFVSDGSNSRVMVWTPVPNATGEQARGVLGQADLTTRGAVTAVDGLTSPWGICGTGSTLFVVDSNDHRVLRYSLLP